MRIRDWSSDVCSSDLHPRIRRRKMRRGPRQVDPGLDRQVVRRDPRQRRVVHFDAGDQIMRIAQDAIEREQRKARREARQGDAQRRSEEHTSELQSLMRISYAVFCLKKKKIYTIPIYT